MLPDQLKTFSTAAQKLYKQSKKNAIEFSGGTYQVQFVDDKTGNEVWSFLQIDEKGSLKDSFCSCEEGEETHQCLHIAAAYLRIFNGQPIPLHQRFQRSLWNALCKLFAERLGYSSKVLKNVSRGYYKGPSLSAGPILYLKGKADAADRLLELMQQRNKQTEETSLKFSNLSQEEIALWKEGHPSSELKYELSFWNDLAKWLLFLQETEEYQITFEHSKKHLPNYLRVKFPDLECGFYLFEPTLPQIIPALATVKSPLTVHNQPEEAIKRITYDKKEGAFHIDVKTLIASKKESHQKQYTVGGWIFIEKDGFYPQGLQGLLSKSTISPDEISAALQENYHVIKARLENTKLHHEPVPVNYAISFDSEWNLHVACYVFTPGDLSKPESRYFGEWVYLDPKGFYHLAERQFDAAEIIVPADEVGDFVRRNRSWLNTQEGFETHLASIESQLSYMLSPENRLTFVRKLTVSDDATNSKDFGSWVYIEGQGFYAKVSSYSGLPVRPDIVIGSDQIPLFIRMNHSELSLVPGFFSDVSPVSKADLAIKLDEQNHIEVSPRYELLERYHDKDVRFFDDFVYVAGEGFHELLGELRLPERYRHTIHIEPENEALFLSYELDKIKSYASYIDPRLKSPPSLVLKAISIKHADEAGKGWYELKLGYDTEAGFISAATIWTAIKKKQRFLFAPEGLLDLSQRRFNWLRNLVKNRLDRRSNTILLSTMEVIRLNAFDEIEVQKGKGVQHDESVALLRELTEFRIPEDPELEGLHSHLRPYQQLGLRWLWFLYHHSLSGLLCDDMGLGKTHQAMALMAAVSNFHKKRKKDKPLHFLVICPTSVIYHWQEKLQTFFPDARVCTFHGSNRSLKDFQQQYDILLTSYGIWRMERDLLSQVPFEVAIFDEVQIGKNHHSRIYSSLLKVNAQMRIGLTGTPIENHLRELKALFDIVIPHYMPGESDYREFFMRPIEREHNIERQELLTRFIKPFLLRRKKEQVLLDLPEKTEEIAHCELMPEQQLLYNEVLVARRQKVMLELQDESQPIPYLHIFSILSALKQICDHPAVYYKTPEAYKSYESGKWDLFLELLNEARDSRQKVVVFTQYLGMLDIMEEYLNEQGIQFATIRGSTSNRGEQIHRFNNDPNCEVFIGSLQAAGLGVDLTAGSVVIHYDRWWNAARENQATDRVHRIGQTRGVQVFKLVTKNTLEERIDQIIFRKGRIMEEVVTADEHQVIKQLDRQEIMQLLQTQFLP